MKNENFEAIYERAWAAGVAAATKTIPTPMAVQATNSLTGEFDWNKPYEVVYDGSCGFAWVNIRPASPAGRNDAPFVKWLRAQARASESRQYGRYNDYEKCWQIWIGNYNQSVGRKEAHAVAMVEVLKEAGIRASAGSRLD